MATIKNKLLGYGMTLCGNITGLTGISQYGETFRSQTYRWLYDRIKPNTLLLDIGANIGDTATYFAMHPNVKEIWSYECDDKIYGILERNLAISAFSKPIKTYHTKLLKLPKLEELTTIKCDVEGSEYDIFNIATDLSQAYAIMLEYHDGIRELEDIFQQKGFRTLNQETEIVDGKQIGYAYAWKDD